MKKLFLLLWVTNILFAGNTGKIAGFVFDKESGEPLVGANVLVISTLLGASTDLDGSYYILQIPPGTYELEVQYVGYQKIILQNVQIQSDLTAQMNFEMVLENLETEEIVIVADRPLVQMDVTSTRTSATGEEMVNTPGVENVLDIFKMQAGAVSNLAPPNVTLSNGVKLQARDGERFE